MKKQKTAVVLVLDAAGLVTIEYLLSKYGGEVRLPNLARLGLGDIILPQYRGRITGKRGGGYAARLEQQSASADSVIGHREMVGICDDRTFSLFPDGFDKKFIAELEKRIGRKTIFNKMAGGVEAIELNAEEHRKTGCPIVYASKCDPLIQIAMDESVIPVPEQHKIADTAFETAMRLGIPVTRAIARAYVRTPEGEYVRTPNRHDAVLAMGKKTLVDLLYARDVWTVAVGKTSELVNTVYHDKIKLTGKAFIDPALGLNFVHPGQKDTNPYSVQGTVNALLSSKTLHRPNGTFVFSNLVDTDSLYGHTRDVEGSIKCLEEADRTIPVIENHMDDGDLLIVTADHGMAHRADYGYHNREALPLLAERKGLAELGGLVPGKARTLADVGYLCAQFFGCEAAYLRETGTAALIQ
ncbi:MAG: hypothetical protein PHW69_07945 [Elusimicrobiaceae bacterium]|nr:hypothetical protein [Elusimicrobiaceae bacterium]